MQQKLLMRVQTAESFSTVAADLPDNIMQRRCPKMQRFSHGSAHDVRVSKRKRLQPYALKVSAMLLTSHAAC